MSSLAQDGTSTDNTEATIPATIVGGNYFIGAIADPYNSVTESDENNNLTGPVAAATRGS